MVRIPEEYQEVEYLESTGNGACIDSGIECTSNLAIDFGFTALTNVNLALCGGINTQNAPVYFRHHATPNGGNILYYLQNNNSNGSAIRIAPMIGKYQELKVNPTSGQFERKCNGETTSGHFTPITNYFTTGKSFGIFGRIADTGDIQSRPSRCYYFKFYINDEMIGNFIPCYRKSDNEAGMYDTVSGTFYTNSGTDTFLVGNPVEYSTISLLEARRRILLNTPHLESISGATASFETDMSAKLKECKVYFTPIQEGTGDPSPDNVRPIHGWDGVTVNLTGKNLFDASGEYLNNKWINNNGEIVDSLNNRPTLLYTQKIPVVSGTDYTIHGACNNIQYIRIVYYDENDNFLGRVVSDGKPNPSKKFTPITGTAYVLVNPDTAIQNIQLEKGSSATTYEPYTAQSLIVPFPQTIYGGYVDLVKGEVVEEWNNVKGDDLNWSKSIGNYSTFITTPSTKPKKQDNNNEVLIWSSHYKSESWRSASTVGNKYVWVYSNGLIRLKDTKKQDLTAEEFVVTVADADFCYKIPPTTYPLDPVTIRTLKGLNNIFSSANGNIEISYWTH